MKKIKVTKNQEVLAPYSIHDAVIEAYQYSNKTKSLELQVKPVHGKGYRIIVSGIKSIKVEFWEALIIFTLFAFEASKVNLDDYCLDTALNKLFNNTNDREKNFQKFIRLYPDSYLFYLSSSYGGEFTIIADSIEFCAD